MQKSEDPNLATKLGVNPLFAATAMKDVVKVELMLTNAKVETNIGQGNQLLSITPVHVAACQNSLTIFEKLTKVKENLFVQTKTGEFLTMTLKTKKSICNYSLVKDILTFSIIIHVQCVK